MNVLCLSRAASWDALSVSLALLFPEDEEEAAAGAPLAPAVVEVDGC